MTPQVRSNPPLDELVALFLRSGALRLPDAKRRAATPRAYKKGYEVRIVAHSKQELRRIRRLLREAGLPVAAWFAKERQFVQPLYGKQHVRAFREAVEHSRRKGRSA